MFSQLCTEPSWDYHCVLRVWSVYMLSAPGSNITLATKILTEDHAVWQLWVLLNHLTSPRESGPHMHPECDITVYSFISIATREKKHLPEELSSGIVVQTLVPTTTTHCLTYCYFPVGCCVLPQLQKRFVEVGVVLIRSRADANTLRTWWTVYKCHNRKIDTDIVHLWDDKGNKWNMQLRSERNRGQDYGRLMVWEAYYSVGGSHAPQANSPQPTAHMGIKCDTTSNGARHRTRRHLCMHTHACTHAHVSLFLFSTAKNWLCTCSPLYRGKGKKRCVTAHGLFATQLPHVPSKRCVTAHGLFATQLPHVPSKRCVTAHGLFATQLPHVPSKRCVTAHGLFATQLPHVPSKRCVTAHGLFATQLPHVPSKRCVTAHGLFATQLPHVPSTYPRLSAQKTFPPQPMGSKHLNWLDR